MFLTSHIRLNSIHKPTQITSRKFYIIQLELLSRVLNLYSNDILYNIHQIYYILFYIYQGAWNINRILICIITYHRLPHVTKRQFEVQTIPTIGYIESKRLLLILPSNIIHIYSFLLYPSRKDEWCIHFVKTFATRRRKHQRPLKTCIFLVGIKF